MMAEGRTDACLFVCCLGARVLFGEGGLGLDSFAEEKRKACVLLGREKAGVSKRSEDA
jgi:hypothetical protein